MNMGWGTFLPFKLGWSRVKEMDDSYKYLGIWKKSPDKSERDEKGLRLHHCSLSDLRGKREEANCKEDRIRATET